MELKEAQEALSIETAAAIVQIFDSESTIEDLGFLSEDASAKLRVLAIIALLSDANINLYYHHLIRSARVRINFLKKYQGQHSHNFFRLASSRNEPLFDAMAANDFERSSRIATLSPKQWFTNAEYEDDYEYTQFLHNIIVSGLQDFSKLQSIMDQFENVLSGISSARFDICCSFLKIDQDLFDQAFENLILERENQIVEELNRARMVDAISLADHKIFIEGLALLRLAEKNGFVTQKEYRFCPEIARMEMSKPFPGE